MSGQKNNYLLLLVMCSLILVAETRLYTRVSPSGSSIQLKWYGPGLVNTSGYDVYRQEGSGNWYKLNKAPLLSNKNKLQALITSEDLFLKAAAKLCMQTPLESLSLLTVAFASFKSEKFCEAIGIFFEDSTVIANRNYRYKLIHLENNLHQTETLSGSILAGNYLREVCPQKLDRRISGNKINFSWLEESTRYYGVKVYRRQADSAANKCLTEYPILFTGAVHKSDTFSNRFADVVPKAGGTFYYTFFGLDYFDSQTEISPALVITFPDLEAPAAPGKFWQENKGRHIILHWEAVKNCKDLKEYQLFRTTHNDSDYKKIKSITATEPMLLYKDSVNVFQSYSYRLHAVDKSGNLSSPTILQVDLPDLEAPSAPAFITARGDSGKILIQWRKNAEKDLLGYIIYRSINDTLRENFVKITPNPLTTSSFSDELPANVKNNFLYKIYALDRDLNRSKAGEIISCHLPDITAPKAPFLLPVQRTEKNLNVEWFKNAERDLMLYTLFILSDDTMQTEMKIKLSRTSVNYKLKAGDGRHYKFRMTATDSSGNESPYSNVVNCRSTKLEAEKEISLAAKLRYEKKSRLLFITWKKRSFADSVSFVVFRKLGTESIFYPVSGNLAENSFTESAPYSAVEIQYQVRAYLRGGEVIKSNILKTISHEKANKEEE